MQDLVYTADDQTRHVLVQLANRDVKCLECIVLLTTESAKTPGLSSCRLKTVFVNNMAVELELRLSRRPRDG